MCDEAVLFERETFLILSQHHEGGKEDLITCEKVANIIKQFKLTCKYFIELFSKVGANFNSIEVATSNFTCLIMEFTKTENILIIYKNPVLSNFASIQLAI